MHDLPIAVLMPEDSGDPNYDRAQLGGPGDPCPVALDLEDVCQLGRDGRRDVLHPRRFPVLDVAAEIAGGAV